MPDIHQIYGLAQSRFRPARLRSFLNCFQPGSHTTILDVGGEPQFWDDLPTELNITIANIRSTPDSLPSNITYVEASATELPFEDDSFDIVFSNSMIEHLYEERNQIAFANEARRIGSGIWIQTPARWFPIEPHMLTPFIHYLPKSAQKRLLRHFTVWGAITKPNQSQVKAVLAETRLLSAGDMREIFIDCEIRRERFLGMTKSLIAVRAPAARSAAR